MQPEKKIDTTLVVEAIACCTSEGSPPLQHVASKRPASARQMVQGLDNVNFRVLFLTFFRMSRWRPPAEKSTALITPAGHAMLKAELDDLWRVRRPEVVRALSAAAAEGDRSENAEYTYRKKQLGEIDRRVRYLSKRLEALRVVDAAPSDPQAVFFGAQVELEDNDTGETARYRIVGPDETDAALGHISIDSPLARAMLKKRVDDEFEAALPGRTGSFVIVAVSYGAT